MIAQEFSFMAELRADVCRCGAAKRAGRPFCFDCFRILPADVQKGLYRRIGRGYEGARVKAERFFPQGDDDGDGNEGRQDGPRRVVRGKAAFTGSPGGKASPTQFAPVQPTV